MKPRTIPTSSLQHQNNLSYIPSRASKTPGGRTMVNSRKSYINLNIKYDTVLQQLIS